MEDGRHIGYEIVIPEWLYTSVVQDKLVLTLDSGYFEIKGGLERWLYLFARKSSGYNKDGWAESIESIYRKSGSRMTLKEFRRRIQVILSKGEILGYQIGWSGDIRGKQELFFPRKNEKLISKK